MPEIEEKATPDATREETPVEQKPAPASEAATEGEQDSQEQEEKKKGGWQRRIDKLTRERYELREQLAEMRGRLAVQPAPATHTSTEDSDPKPDIQKFPGTYEEFTAALVRWEARQEYKQLSAKAKEAAANAERDEREKEVVTSYKDRAREFAEEHDDFDQVIGKLRWTEEIANSAAVALMEDENGPALAYYLGENPEVFSKLNDMTAAGAVKYLGRLSERLFPEPPDTDEEEEEKEDETEDETPPARPPATATGRRKLPAPITPTKRSAPTDRGLSDSLSTDEWAKRFRKKMGYD